MAALYSARLYSLHSFGPGLDLGPTVPTGEVWVVKSVAISYGVNVISGRALLSGAGATIAETGAGFGISYPGTFALYGTFPLEAGDQLVTEVLSWTIDLWVGGFKFTTP